MNAGGFNPLDVAVVVVVLLSAALAFARGFAREVLSVFAWVGAILVALYAFPHVAPLVRAKVETRFVADVLAGGAVFTGALIVFSMVSHRLTDGIRAGSLSAIDRSLGFGFGAFRGVVIACLAYLFMVFLWPGEAEQPDWFKTARTRPMLEGGAGLLKRMVPNADGDSAARDAQAAEDRRVLERLSTPEPQRANPAAPQPDQGYKTQERGNIDQLIKNLDEQRADPPPRQ